MDYNIKVFIWIMIGNDESKCNRLERNILQLDNIIWNVIEVDESDWYVQGLNVFQCEGFNMNYGGI